MKRRSTRLKENPVKLMTEEPDTMDHPAEVDEVFEDEPAVTKKKPRGRKRKAVQDKDNNSEGQPQTKRPRGKRGLLKQLVEMPLDVLFEIFGQLEPLDLLHLSRTTKDVRALLLSRSSISIWKQSRTKIVGLPECPDDLSEPQYAELAFSKRCYDCQRNLSTNQTIWSARVRYCTKCLDKHFVHRGTSYRCPSDLSPLLPTIYINRKSGRYMKDTLLFSLDTDMLWRDEYKKQDTSEGRKNWLAKKVLEQKTIIAHGDLCEVWFDNLQDVRELQKASLIEDRKAMVVERLKKLGWGYELERIPAASCKPQDDPVIVKACQKELTERVLSNLEDYLSQIMEEHKAHRVSQERRVYLKKRLPLLRQVYNTYISTLPATTVYPNTADIFRLPLVRDAIDNLPSDVDLTEGHYDVVRQLFPEAVLQWQQRTEEALIAMIMKACPEYVFDPEKVLCLATTFFYCPACPYPVRNLRSLRHTRAMMHECTRACIYAVPENATESLAVKGAISQIFWNWNNKISFLPETLKLMTDVVEACGFDPKTTTAQEMDDANPIIECISCNDLRQGRLTMTWAGVIAHDYEKHNHPYREDKHPMNFVVLGEQEATFVRARMADLQARSRAEGYGRAMTCNHCQVKGNTVDLKTHVKQEHGKANVMSEDIVPSIDYCHIPPLYRLWPPRPEEEQPPAAEAIMDTT